MEIKNIKIEYVRALNKYLTSFEIPPTTEIDSLIILQKANEKIGLPNFSSRLGSIKQYKEYFLIQIWSNQKPVGVILEV